MSASELENLHLADLHALASEHGVSDFRKLRRRQLIVALQEVDTDELEVLDSAPAKAADDAPEDDGDEIVIEGTVLPADDEEPVELGAGGAEEGDDKDDPTPTDDVHGYLELTRQRWGFLRLTGLSPDPGDVYISAAQVRRCELRPGDEVSGPAREPRRGERHRALVHVDAVNGTDPAIEVNRPEFDALDPIVAERRLPLDGPDADVLVRALDLLAPLAFGQRVLVRAAPRSGRTTLLRGIARAAAEADAKVIVLLVDERPEEATAWREALPVAEFAIATADYAPAEQVRIAELALERAKRIAETGGDVVLVCDSLSRLAFAAGGVDEVKRIFGAGRNLTGAGSLTVVATTIDGAHDEGAAERATLTTESALATLDPELAAAGVTPALAVGECRASNEDELREAEELDAARKLRAELAELDAKAAAEFLRERIEGSPSNAELLTSL